MLRGDVIEGEGHEVVVSNVVAEGDGQAVECVDVNRSLAQISADHEVDGLLVHVATEESLEKDGALADVVSGRVPTNDGIFGAKATMEANHLLVVLDVHRDLEIKRQKEHNCKPNES